MRTFQEAHAFVMQKSSLEIFYEILPYTLKAQDMGKQFGHDRIAILMAAFGGKFDASVFNDPALRDLLDMTNWGWDNHGTGITAWGEKYAKTQTDEMYFDAMASIVHAKSDEVYGYLVENARTGFAYRPGSQFS